MKKVSIKFINHSKLKKRWGQLKQLIYQLKRTWYLWLPIIDVLMVISLKLLSRIYNEDIPRVHLFTWDNDFHKVILITLLIFSAIKSRTIICYSYFGKDKSVHSSLWFFKLSDKKSKQLDFGDFLFYLLMSLLFLILFYYNWIRISIFWIIVLEVLVYVLSSWLQKMSVFAHILADIFTVIVLFFAEWIVRYMKIESPNNLFMSIFTFTILLIRYLIVVSVSTELENLKSKKIFLINETNYFFSEWYSGLLFLTAMFSILSDSNTEKNITVNIFVGAFIYYIFMYLRLFLYRQYGMSAKEVYYSIMTTISMFFYIIIMNVVDIDIIVWFFPVLILLLADDMLDLSSKTGRNQQLSMTRRGKRLFSRLKLFFIITLFINHVFVENKQFILNYDIFNLSLNNIDNIVMKKYVILPFIAVILSMFCTLMIERIVNKNILSNSYLINSYKYRNIKYKYPRSRRKRIG